MCKTHLKKVITILFYTFPLFVWGQSINDSTSTDSLYRLPSLQVLIDTAIANSPSTKIEKLAIQTAKREATSERLSIFKIASFNTGYTYGNTGVLSVSESSANNAINSFSSTQNARYYIGASINLPLNSLLDRNNQIQLAKIRIEEKKLTLEETNKAISEEVTLRYYRLYLAGQLLKINIDKLHIDELNLQVTKKMFLKGEATVSDLTRVSESLNKAQIDVETIKVEYLLAKKLLEQYIGVKLEALL